MPRINYTNEDVALLARMMRAEAAGEGREGMLHVGNVIVNRVVANCLDFQNINSVRDAIFQIQGGNFSFEAVQKGNLFYKGARPNEKELARKVLNGWRQFPSKYALWYFNPPGPEGSTPQGSCPTEWFGEPFAGRYRNHCFYEPAAGTCPGVYIR
ncbi:cell wall hydrolase [Virgibacillus ihumii]|uniref:cell wall hydrolase n=1 Tax=Virgibacillus ihumii TaxID=2686091 RepID=UPI00157C0B0F|nr:cell wall hydrolase [Virgibacillus ihumii]